MSGALSWSKGGYERQFPPPPGYEPPKLKEQLRGGAFALLSVVGLVNVLLGFWLWRVLRSGRVGSGVTTVLGIIGLALIDVVAGALVLYARARK